MYWLISLVKRFLFLSILIGVWVGILWFVIRLDISRFNLLSLAAIHALPPLGVWGGWSLWRRYAAAKKLKAEETAQEQVVVEQQVKHDAERKSFDAALRERQFALDCRWAEVCSNQAELISSDEVETMSESDSNTPASDRLLASLTQSLANLFSLCPGAQRLPIFVAESALFDRELASRAIAACCDAAILPQVRVLPFAEGVANAIFSRFESDPSLPGALFLSVDGSDQPDMDDDDVLMPAPLKTADALVVLLFTHPEYAAAVTELTSGPNPVGEKVDPMTPFWERDQRQLQGLTERLSRFPGEARDSLADLEIVGKLRRPVEVAGKKPESAWRSAIEQALINAELKPLHFKDDAKDAETMPSEAEEDIPCAWIVHNAGAYESSGDRLAALGRGLDAHGIELNIIRQATNVLAQVKLGVVDQWASVALALTRAKSLEAPTLWAVFGSRSAVGLITNVKA